MEPDPKIGLEWRAMAETTPTDRVLQARLAAHALHAQHDSRRLTEPARRAFLDRFEHQVDPEHLLGPRERERRAEQARRSYFTALALKSARARRRRKG